MVDLSIILPVHNEEYIIRDVCSQVKKIIASFTTSYEILLIENGSTDQTLSVLKKIEKENTTVHSFIAPKGYGSAILKGISKATGKYICYMPSDGQVDVSILPILWKTAATQSFDLVKVKRKSRESLSRTLTSWGLAFVLHLFFGTPFVDVNGSPRILLRKKLVALQLVSLDSFIDSEMLIKVKKCGWTIKEIPMKHLERLGGKSTRSINTYLEFVSNIFTYVRQKKY